MQNSFVTLPVNRACSIRMDEETKGLSIQATEMQEAGKPVSEFKPVVIAYYRRMRSICSKFQEYRDPANPRFWHTLCSSGASGVIRRGSACLDCEAFDVSYHPGLDPLIQIESMKISRAS